MARAARSRSRPSRSSGKITRPTSSPSSPSPSSCCRPCASAATGCIVNIGSVAGKIARPLSSIYDSTKHALEALTDGLRGELKPFGVRVTLIRPGFILTEFVEAANAASTEVIANAGPYAPFYKGYSESTTTMRRVAGVPDDIARLVKQALTADNPAPRYNGPFHAKIFLLLKWLLPDRALAFIVRLRK
jgi:NAD(P)-dependent dehydrogenase (short-subunit alcohol dehydrogenase family)